MRVSQVGCPRCQTRTQRARRVLHTSLVGGRWRASPGHKRAAVQLCPSCLGRAPAPRRAQRGLTGARGLGQDAWGPESLALPCASRTQLPQPQVTVRTPQCRLLQPPFSGLTLLTELGELLPLGRAEKST